MRDRRRRRRCDRYLVARAQRELDLALGALDHFRAVGHLVLLLRVSSTVIRPGAVQRFDLQFLRALRDFQFANCRAYCIVSGRHVAPGDLVSVIARADVGLRAGDLHRNAVRSGESYRYCRACRQGGIRSIKGRLATCRQGRAVVFLLCGIRYDRQRCGSDAQLADLVLALRVEALVLYYPGEGVVHGGLVHMRDRRRCRRRDRHHIARAQLELVLAALGVQSRRSALVTVGHRVDRIRMRGSVIRPALRRGLDLQFCSAGLDFKFADSLVNSIVSGGYITPCDLVGVVALAHRGLRAGDLHCNAVRSGQGYRHCSTGSQRRIRFAERRLAACRQGRTVVFFLCGIRHDRQRCGSDAQFADLVLTLRVTRFIVYRPGECVIHSGLVNMCNRCCRFRRNCYLVTVFQRCHCRGIAFPYGHSVALFAVRHLVFVECMRGSVIRPALRFRLDL